LTFYELSRMNKTIKKVVIIGAGPAGVSVARTLRENGFGGSIDMFSAEAGPPYSPVALGEYLVTGDEDLLRWQGKDFFARYAITARSKEKIVEVDPEGRRAFSEKSRTVYFDMLAIATGSSFFTPSSVEGKDKKGLLNFKSLSGTRAIKSLAQKGLKTATILGGGFIGVEIALCLEKIGIKPCVLNRRGWIMPRLLDPETSEYVLEDLRQKGIEVALNTEGRKFYGDKKIEGLITTEGRKITSDMFIAATGVKPNIDFVLGSGIQNDGLCIPVDKKMRTNYPWIFACGDVAGTSDFITGERTVHALHPVAVSHGKTAALNILGYDLDCEPQISMNSLKKLSFKVIVVGSLAGEEMKFKKNGVLRKVFVNQDKRINGFVLLGDISNAGHLLAMLKKREKIDGAGGKIAWPGNTRAILASRYFKS